MNRIFPPNQVAYVLVSLIHGVVFVRDLGIEDYTKMELTVNRTYDVCIAVSLRQGLSSFRHSSFFSRSLTQFFLSTLCSS